MIPMRISLGLVDQLRWPRDWDGRNSPDTLAPGLLSLEPSRPRLGILPFIAGGKYCGFRASVLCWDVS